MSDYKALYFGLFNDVTDTIERLKQAQQKAEQEYMDEKSPENVKDSNRKLRGSRKGCLLICICYTINKISTPIPYSRITPRPPRTHFKLLFATLIMNNLYQS